MALKSKLGRGLSALIRDETPASAAAAEERPQDHFVPVESIRKNPLQPRHRFNPETLAELTQSVREHGVIQPLLVRPVAGGYELVAGERRLRAAGEAGLKEVPVVVIQATDNQSLEMALVENLQREDLNVIEEAEGYQLLGERFAMTQESIAARVGKARATVANALRLLSLPDEVKALITAGTLTPGHAKLLAGLTSPEEQKRLARQIAEDNLTVRQAEKEVRQHSKPRKTSKTSRDDIPANHIQWLSDKLHSHFGTSIHINSCRTLANGKKIRGQLTIDFFSNEDLDRVLNLLGVNLE